MGIDLSIGTAITSQPTQGGGGAPDPILPIPPVPDPILWLEEGQSDLYQDSGRTTLVTGDGDPIGSISDLSGNDNHPTAPGTGNRPTYRAPGLTSLNEWDHISSATCSATDVLTLPDGGVGDWARTQPFTVSAVIHTDNKPNNRNYVGKNVSSGNFEGWHLGLRTGTDRPFFRMFDTGGGQLFVEMINTISNGSWQALTWTYDGTSAPGGLSGYVGTTSQSLNTVTNTLTGDITNSIPFGVGLNYAGLTGFCQNGLDGGMRALFVYDSELIGGDLTALLAYMHALSFSTPADIENNVTRVFDANNNTYTDLGKTTPPADTAVFRVWEDSDNSLDFTAPASSARPIYRLTGTGGNADFDGANDYLAAPNTALADFGPLDPFSVYIVTQFDTIGTTDILVAKCDRTANVRGWLFFASSTGLDMYLQFANSPGNRTQVHWTNNVSAGVPYWFALTYDGSGNASGWNLTRNGVAQTRVLDVDTLTLTTSNSVPLNIGNRDNGSQGGEGADAKISELVIFDKELSAAELDILDDYTFRTYNF